MHRTPGNNNIIIELIKNNKIIENKAITQKFLNKNYNICNRLKKIV